MDFKLKDRYDVEDLLRIVELLRDPAEGCPWDKVQTHLSIRKNLLEEAYEAAEALDADDPHMMMEELGDLTMHAIFHARIEQERGRFDFNDVCDSQCKKLIFRHPHIFGEEKGNTGSMDWEMLKEQEKGRKTLAQQLDSVPLPLPALMKAQKTLSRAQRYGVTVEPLKQSIDPDRAEEQVGDLLLAAVALAREVGVDAEEALTRAVKRFADAAKQDNDSKH